MAKSSLKTKIKQQPFLYALTFFCLLSPVFWAIRFDIPSGLMENQAIETDTVASYKDRFKADNLNSKDQFLNLYLSPKAKRFGGF